MVFRYQVIWYRWPGKPSWARVPYSSVASLTLSPLILMTLSLVTTKTFLSQFGLQSLHDLPDREALEDAGLLSKEKLIAGDIPIAISEEPDDGERGLEIDLQSDVPD